MLQSLEGSLANLWASSRHLREGCNLIGVYPLPADILAFPLPGLRAPLISSFSRPNCGWGIFESSSSNNTQTITSYPKSKSPNTNPKFLNPNPNCGRGNFEPSSSNNTQTITSYPWLSITAVQPSLSKLATRSTLRIFSPSRTVRNPRCPQGMLLIRWNIPFFTHQFPPPSRNSVKSIKIHLSLVHPCQKISRSFMRILISKQSTRNAFICCRFMALSVAHL